MQYGNEAHGGYVVIATWPERDGQITTHLIGVFATEDDAHEFVVVENANGACASHTVAKLSLPSASPVQAKGRW